MTGGDWSSVLVGQVADDYLLLECVGTGGFGMVMKAIHNKTKEEVAIKFLLPSARLDDQSDFTNERELLLQLIGSSNVVKWFKSDSMLVPMYTSGGPTVDVSFPYHVLELAQDNLETLVANRESLAIDERIKLWRDVVLGVHQMHLKEVVHRDLKSGNCLLFVRAKNKTDCKVSDLGRSRNLKNPPRHTPESYLAGLGDMRFAPPEFLAWQGDDSKIGHICSDLYGLGSVLFELFTGQPITAYSLGYGPQILEQNLRLLQKGFKIDLSGMRSSFEPAYSLFEASCPKAIKRQAGLLLRQLCDPVPSGRLPKLKFDQKIPEPGLEWLLKRADILKATVHASSKAPSKQANAFPHRKGSERGETF